MRKILIISTTFFPDPTVSAIRMTQWCRNLPRLGWQPHVLCRYYGHRCTSEELAERVHPDVTLEYIDAPASDVIKNTLGSRLRGFTRGVLQMLGASPRLSSLFVADPSIHFWKRNRQKIMERLQAIQPDVILTTSPPHSIHDIGLWLTAQTGIPWVADFRDPYLTDNRFEPKGLGLLRWGSHRRFKDSIYRRAWLITHAIPNQYRWARRHYHNDSHRMLALTNGYPPELIGFLNEPANTSAKRRTVLVAGTIPEPQQLSLAQAVARLANEGYDLQLKLVGMRPASGAKLSQVLGDRLVLTGYVPHIESIREVAMADVLVNYLDEFRSKARLLSTKLFEYFASGKPVLVINPSRGDRLLHWRMTGVKSLVKPSPDDVVAALRQALDGELRRDPAEVENFRKEFNWQNSVGNLALALDRLCEFPPRLPPPVHVEAPAVATVVITTRNRQSSISATILSALHQSVPVEVLVVDDGSTDGTSELIRRDFPQVRLIRHDESRGYIVRRNEGARLAKSPVIFSLDDDAVFTSPHVVGQTLKEFNHERVGAVAIPLRNVRKTFTLLQQAPDDNALHVTCNYIGTAHAVRRDPFLAIRGYRESLVHQGEEQDFCIRMLQSGRIVRLGKADPIHHYESPFRESGRMDFYGRRNDVLFAWHHVPALFLPIHLVATTFNGLRTAIESGNLKKMLLGLCSGYTSCVRRWHERKPVSMETYLLHRKLKKSGATALDEIEPRLPPLPPR